MKKRVLAALLALVMLFGALPMSVFAADDTATYAVDSTNMPSTTPTLTVGNFILICEDGPHGDSGEDDQGCAAMPANGQYKATTVEEYWDTAKQAWIYTIEVDTDAVMARFARFDSEHELLDRKVVATWQYNTTYNAWYPVSETTGYVATLHIGLKNSGSTTVDPTKVTPEFLDTASIHYVCDTCTPSSYYIDITSGMYNVTEHSETTFRIEWNDKAILKAYNDLYPGHTWDEQGNGSSSYHIDPFAMTWTWDATTQKWTRSGSPTIRAYVKSTASSGTDEPGNVKPDLDSMGVLVWCIDSADGHATKKITYKLNVLSYTGGAEKVGNKWKYSVTIDWDSIFDNFNQTIGTNHKKSGAYPSNGTITWTWTNGTWVLDEPYNIDGTTYLAYARVMYDESAAVPDHPDDLEQYKLYFKIACDDTTHDHSNLKDNVLSYLTIAYATNSTYGLWRASKTEDTYTVTIKKAGLDAYMDDEESNGTMFTGHDVDTIAPTTLEWKLKNNAWVYQGEKTEYKGGKAIVVNVNAKAEVVEAPVPTEELLSKGSFSIASVYCGYDVNDTTHDPYVMRCSAVNYIEGSFVENSAVKNADGTYTVKIRTAPYVDYFNQVYVKYNCPHKAKTETVPVTLAYTPDGELSEWQVVTVNGEKQRADIPVYCEKAPDAPSITLTYNANAPEGKTVTNLPKPQTESLPAGSSVVTFQLSWAIPVCEGYKFLGWATDTSSTIATFPVENLGTDSWVSTTGEPNYILYAIWEKNPFHVTYRLKDENGKWVNAYEEDVPVAGCENHTLWTPAEKTGYKFTGWYQKAEDIGKKAEVTKLFDKTWVLYGDYTPVEYTITYDYRDKDIADKNLYPENAETYTIEDTVTLNPITNKGMFGKTFLEWRCDLNKDGVAEKITEIPAGTTGNLTVYAYWNYPVSYTVYDEDGNEVEAYCETINVPEDSFGANLKPKSVEKDGYEFDGWYQNPKNFGNPNKRTETLDNAKNWKLYGKLKYLEKPVYVYVQPTYKGIALTKSDAKAVAALARLGFTEGFNAGGKFVTLGKMMTAKTDVAGMVDEIDNGKLALYSEIDTTKFNEHVLNSIGWYSENALTLVTNTTHKGYEADGKIDAYHLNGTMSFQSVTFDAGTNDKVENMPADGYYLVNDRITLSAPTREGYTFLGWSAAQDTPVITANPETDGETLYPADHEWTVIGDVTFTAVWELNLQTVNVVIYRNGDMTKAFKTVSLEKQPKGTVIDLTTLDIANYYTANSTGKYDFYGWYNDGRWNEYKANPENPPAGLEKITVNGWTNIICMVYDYEKVIVKAITDDNKATETQLFSGMARRGSNLLDYLAAQNIELDKVGHTHDEWYKYDSPKWKFGENDTINGWTNVLVKYARKEYTVVAKMYLDGAPHYRQNTDFYTYQVTGLYGDPIDFSDIKAQAIAQAEKDRPASASYDASVIEDWAGNATCTTFGEHQPDLDTPHYVNVHVNTTQHVYVYRMIDGKMEATEYHHSTAPFGANVVEHLNANVQNLDMPGYSHDEWFKKDVPALDVKFGDTDTINGWTNVVIKYTKNEFPVTYDYACTDPALVPNWKVWETLPENPYTYAPGESVRVAMMPDDVEDGEYIWKFVTWKLNGVDVVPNAQVPMVEGGLTFVGIWERTQKEYGVTYDYACTDPALVPNWKVWATLPENKDTYTVGQKVTTAAKPDDVEDGEYIWKFVTWKLGDTEVAPNTQVEMVAGGLTFVGIWEHTQKEYGVTYSYDPSLPDEVQATLPKNPDTYTVGQKVTTAAKPNSVRVGENIWTFKTWKLDGVEVAPNTQVEMVSGGLHFEGIWETKLIHYSLTIQYVDKKGKELAESHMDLLSKGEAYKVDSPKIKGYKLKDKDKAVIEGTMPGRNLTIEVVYIKKSTGGSSGTIDSPNKPTTKAPALTLNTEDHFAFINGYPDGSVQPEGNVTRAETAAILYRIMGDECQSYYKTNSSSYSDVARGDWYNTYVATLENAGVIVDTRTNGKFRPNDAITRAELASMIAQFAGLESASAAKFNDVGSRYWAAEEIAIAAKMGWINGYPDGSFRPDRNVTRAELMAMVNRALGRTPKSADDLLSGMKTWRDNANVNAWYYLDVQEATNDHTYTKSGTHETWKKLL